MKHWSKNLLKSYDSISSAKISSCKGTYSGWYFKPVPLATVKTDLIPQLTSKFTSYAASILPKNRPPWFSVGGKIQLIGSKKTFYSGVSYEKPGT